MRRASLVAMVLAVGLLASGCWWPQVGAGPDRRSYNAPSAADSANVASLSASWTVELPQGASEPIVSDDAVYVTSDCNLYAEDVRGLWMPRCDEHQLGVEVRKQLPDGAYLELFVKVDKDWQRRPKAWSASATDRCGRGLRSRPRIRRHPSDRGGCDAADECVGGDRRGGAAGHDRLLVPARLRTRPAVPQPVRDRHHGGERRRPDRGVPGAGWLPGGVHQPRGRVRWRRGRRRRRGPLARPDHRRRAVEDDDRCRRADQLSDLHGRHVSARRRGRLDGPSLPAAGDRTRPGGWWCQGADRRGDRRDDRGGRAGGRGSGGARLALGRRQRIEHERRGRAGPARGR